MTESKVPYDAEEFTGKRILVTGGTKGAGKAIAGRFQRGGATVVVTARSEPGEKGNVHFIQADVSTAEGTTKVINEVLNRFRGIDIIIHNVGGSSAPSGGFIAVTDEIWQQNMNENLFPAVRLDRGPERLVQLHDARPQDVLEADEDRELDAAADDVVDDGLDVDRVAGGALGLVDEVAVLAHREVVLSPAFDVVELRRVFGRPGRRHAEVIIGHSGWGFNIRLRSRDSLEPGRQRQALDVA